MKNIYLSKYHITERMTRVYWMDLLEDLMKSHIGIIKNVTLKEIRNHENNQICSNYFN